MRVGEDDMREAVLIDRAITAHGHVVIAVVEDVRLRDPVLRRALGPPVPEPLIVSPVGYCKGEQRLEKDPDRRVQEVIQRCESRLCAEQFGTSRFCCGSTSAGQVKATTGSRPA